MLTSRFLPQRLFLPVRFFGLQYSNTSPITQNNKTHNQVTPYQQETKKALLLDTLKTADHLTQLTEFALNNKIMFNGSEILRILIHMERHSEQDELLEEILTNQLPHAEFPFAFQFSRILEILSRLRPDKQLGQDVLEKLVEKALQQVPQMCGSELVQTIAAISKLGVDSKAVMPQFYRFIPSKESFTGREIAVVMNILARSYEKQVNVFLAFKQKSKNLSFDAKQLGVILNSMAKFEYYDEEWIRVLTPQMFIHRRNFTPLGLAFIFNFFAKVEVFHEEIILMCFEEICSKTHQLPQDNIGMILHALAKFDLGAGETYFGGKRTTIDAEEHDQLLHKLCEQIVRQIDTFNPQNISISLFAFSVLNHYHAQTIDLLCARLKKLGLRVVPTSGLNQLYQASLWLSAEYNRALLSAKETKWLEEVVVKKRTYFRNAETSAMHEKVCAVLSELKLPYHSEFSLAPGVLVDIALADSKIILEVDGHHHFFRDSTRRLGFSQFRTRFAGRLGWKIIVIPHFEWNELSDSSQQQKYLQTKLRALGVGLS